MGTLCAGLRQGWPTSLPDTIDLPVYTAPQKPPKTPEDRIKVWRKVFPAQERRYIDTGHVITLMHYFYVLKGELDMRIVYNGTESAGVNDCLWAAHFSLPTIQHVTRSLLPTYYQADLDDSGRRVETLLRSRRDPHEDS
eukprot:scaffold50352_cov40-Cyclotella_meneghiniana.AAC.2